MTVNEAGLAGHKASQSVFEYLSLVLSAALQALFLGFVVIGDQSGDPARATMIAFLATALYSIYLTLLSVHRWNAQRRVGSAALTQTVMLSEDEIAQHFTRDVAGGEPSDALLDKLRTEVMDQSYGESIALAPERARKWAEDRFKAVYREYLRMTDDPFWLALGLRLERLVCFGLAIFCIVQLVSYVAR